MRRGVPGRARLAGWLGAAAEWLVRAYGRVAGRRAMPEAVSGRQRIRRVLRQEAAAAVAGVPVPRKVRRQAAREVASLAYGRIGREKGERHE